MKTEIYIQNRRSRLGMTLVELMVATSVFSMAVFGLVYTHLFALKQDQLVNSKLGASDEARRGFTQMTDDIRSASMWQLGNGSAGSFTPLANGVTQRGNAIQLYPAYDTNSYVRYFFDTTTASLCRKENGAAGYDIVADNLTNTLYFQAEDFQGNLVTDISYRYVICVKLEFAQFQYPLTRVGNGNYYDYYQMEFKVTPHCPNGISSPP